MAFIPVPDTAQINIVYSLDGQTVENVVYYKHDGTPTLADLTNITDAVAAYIRTSLMPALSSAIQLIRVVGVLLDVADGLIVTNTVSLPLAGGDSDAVLPNNVAFCISLRTGNRGRSFRGRNFIPGIAESHVVKSELNSTAAGGLVSAWGGLLAVGTSSGWTMVVVSRFHNHLPRTTGVATPVQSIFAIDNVVDSQRRRLPKRGQ